MKKSASTPAFPSGLGGSVDMMTGSEFGDQNSGKRMIVEEVVNLLSLFPTFILGDNKWLT